MMWTDDPSPQLTEIEDTEPSTSLAENVTVTSCPVLAGFGKRLVKAADGARSLTVSLAEAVPVEPLLSVTVIVIVKLLLVSEPVAT